MSRSVIRPLACLLLAACCSAGCREGEPDPDEHLIGAWSRPEARGATRLYFHPSGIVDDRESQVFPGVAYGWGRKSRTVIQVLNPEVLDVTVTELSAGEIELSWEGGSATLVRAPYGVAADRDAGTCF